jgi:plasmid stabilization system protein ParE
MNFRVIIEPSAEADIESAYDWIAETAPMNAARWFNRIQRAIASLDTMPERYSTAPESAAFGYEIRQLIYGNYRVLFIIRENTVHVLHLRHGAQLPMRPGEIQPPEAD